MGRARIVAIGAAGVMALLAAVAAEAGVSVNLNGSFFRTFTKPTNPQGPACATGVDGNECGVFQLAGLGAANYVYKYGPTFEPTGDHDCFSIDGTFTISLRSDASTISGTLTGIFCNPGYSGLRGGQHSYGHPFSENDVISFTGGTGQFAGLSGTATFTQSAAGASSRGSLIGTLVAT